MIVIRTRNVHNALVEGVGLLREYGRPRDSRNGPVLEIQEPVTTVYSFPRERHLFHPGREDNPFFHLLESLWMLAGANDVEPLAGIVKRMRSYSDDGSTLHGAYGYRWRRRFGFDQLSAIITNLREDPTCRRQVLQMWSASDDLKHFRKSNKELRAYGHGNDVPCNVVATFKVDHDGDLRMTVFCRSNDAIWGAYGANSYHFSVLQEFVARAVGVGVGEMTQVSDSLHAYVHVLERLPSTEELSRNPDPYVCEGLTPLELVSPGTTTSTWDKDLNAFMEIWRGHWKEESVVGIQDRFFRKTALPVLSAYRAYKDKEDPVRVETALRIMRKCHSPDVRLACTRWLERKKRR